MKFCVQNTKHQKEIMYKNFVQEVANSQKSEVQKPNQSSSNKWQLPEKQTTPKGPKQDPQQTLQGFLQTQIGQNCCWWGGQVESCQTV